jgi:hypothetical protein
MSDGFGFWLVLLVALVQFCVTGLAISAYIGIVLQAVLLLGGREGGGEGDSMFLAKILFFSKTSRQLSQNLSEEARHCCYYNITQLGKKKTLPSRLVLEPELWNYCCCSLSSESVNKILL